LLNSTRHGPAATYDPDVGFGEVNAARAVRAADALVAPRRTVGQPPWQRFGGDDPGPVPVIDRPAWVRPLILVVAVLGVAGAAVAVAIAVALARRHPRERRPDPQAASYEGWES
ncbi:MAG: hypothetical protein IRY90_21780, partial [Actinomadura rubrobrunea]|nr:hypothetical protein [Actinomadura rubrobrunea]